VLILVESDGVGGVVGLGEARADPSELEALPFL
jgi:hypothetical protein